MMARQTKARGFTLIELMIAGTISLVVVAGAFVALNRSHAASIASDQRLELAAQARLVMDLIGRDIRTAGDSVQFLPGHCLAGTQSPGAPFGCPAIIEPHPWRLTMSRYMWGAGADGIQFTADDILDDRQFDANPQNVVSYQFVPTQEVTYGGQQGLLGRLERVINPFGFAGQDPEITVVLENVLLDDRMSVSPDGTETDPRRNRTLFQYRILSVLSGEYAGNAAFTQRSTAQGSFILPPVRFYQIPDLGAASAWATNQLTFNTPPYLPDDYGVEIVGLQPDTTSQSTLLTSSGGFASDMRYVLDYNRIRAVNVSFKVVEAREDPTYLDGVDLDPTEAGTARVIQMESTFELKVFSGYLH